MAITSWTDPFSSSTSTQYTTPDGYVVAVVVSEASCGSSAPPPTTGQLWPRGNP
jgi:hypothetical protein